MTATLVTLGVYGTTEASFFNALRDLEVDAFVDVRARRGLRGSQYSYANSVKLQGRLSEMGIAYLHRPDLAPTNEIRKMQQADDDSAGIGKRTRGELSDSFRRGYRIEVLDKINLDELSQALKRYRRPALFCVEGANQACHRGLLADALRSKGWEVNHWVPNA